jgi:hypothetical protein
MIYEITTGLEKIKQIILINRKDWIKNILQSKIIFNKTYCRVGKLRKKECNINFPI